MERIIITILVYGAIVVGLAIGRPYSVSKFGDVTIELNGDTIKCDQITCPVGTATCKVTKSKTDQASNIVERRNICYGSNGDVLLEKTTQDTVAPGRTEKLDVVVGANGSISHAVVSSSGGSSIINGSPNINFDSEAFSKNLQEHIDQSIQRTLDTVKQSLNNSFGSWGGSLGSWN